MPRTQQKLLQGHSYIEDLQGEEPADILPASSDATAASQREPLLAPDERATVATAATAATGEGSDNGNAGGTGGTIGFKNTFWR